MLTNAYFLAKNGADTAENEQHFAEILPKIGNYPAVHARCGAAVLGVALAAEDAAFGSACGVREYQNIGENLPIFRVRGGSSSARGQLLSVSGMLSVCSEGGRHGCLFDGRGARGR